MAKKKTKTIADWRRKYPNHGKPWLEKSERQLKEQYRSSLSSLIKQLAADFGRSSVAIQARIHLFMDETTEKYDQEFTAEVIGKIAMDAISEGTKK